MKKSPDLQEDAARTPTVVLLSGGLDSAACLHFLQDRGDAVSGLFVRYGQPAEQAELHAAQVIASHYAVLLREMEVRSLREPGAGFIPHRNLLLLVCGLLSMEPSSAVVALGIHAGTRYPDCSPQFINAFQDLVDMTTSGTTSITAPFLHWTKPEVLAYCRNVGVPVNLTWSCERSASVACRRCSSCRDREALNE